MALQPIILRKKEPIFTPLLHQLKNFPSTFLIGKLSAIKTKLLELYIIILFKVIYTGI